MRLLREMAEEYRGLLGANFVGMYAHGSLAMDCFRWESSDIDFLLVTEEIPQEAVRQEVLHVLMRRWADAPPRGLEMSAMIRRDCQVFVHPARYWLHLSQTHMAAAQADAAAYCARMQGEDFDLAAHCTVVRQRGTGILGAAIGEVFAPVPREDYLDSIIRDVEGAEEQMKENPLYVTLNLCRVLAAVKEGAVLSKAEGGAWGRDNLPAAQGAFAAATLKCYGTGADFCPDAAEARAFCAEFSAQLDR